MTSLVAFAIACVVTFIVTPPVRQLAEKYDIIDKPDRRRKRHRRLVPLWGGLAVFVGFAAGVWLALGYTDGGRLLLSYQEGFFARRMPFFLAATILLLIIGLLDDRFALPPKVKLLMQVVAAGLVVAAGFRIEYVWFPFASGPQPVWLVCGAAMAVLWLVIATNAFNFIDGLDGLASSQAVIAGATLAVGAFILAAQASDLIAKYQHFLASLLAAGTAGAALGFWRFNRFPARIFLGDAGSNLLGFLLCFAALLLMGSAASVKTYLLVFLVMAWPLLDTVQVVVRRWRRGDPISKADNRHLHHFLVARGFSHSAAVALISAVCLILCGVGLVITCW